MAANTKPKLTYFAGRGLAEFPRLVLAAAGVQYEDNRIESPAELKEKGVLPFGQIPILEVDGQIIAQSVAIARYIARKHHLYGADDNEAVKVDQILDAITDFRAKAQPYRDLPDGEAKDKKKAEYQASILPVWLKYFENWLAKHNTQYFAGNQISIADIRAFDSLWTLDQPAHFPGSVTAEHYPHLKALFDRVASHERIAKWVNERPQTAW